MENVNFKVLEIRKSEKKEGYFEIDVMFNGYNKTVYTYTRNGKEKSDESYSVLIDGCEVIFNEYRVLDITRIYETTNKKRFGSSKHKKYNKISEAIKNEMEEKEIEVKEEAKKEEPKTKNKKEVKKEEEPFDYTKEVFHDKFSTIKACIENNIPVYLAGPAGSGKNHTLEQIAKQLDLEFYFTNSVQQEYKLTGFIDAGGKYHETEFYKAFVNGGIFFLDEMDASIPEVLVLLNAAIANKYFEFPNGKVNAHKNFRVVAAGNTMGNGADEMYTGRMVLDQATLDRFAVIEFDYCEKIEMALSKGNKELVQFVHQMRKEAEEKGIRATFSYRCISMVTKLESVLDLDEVLKITILKGFDKDTLNTFRPYGGTKYHKALNNIRMAV